MSSSSDQSATALASPASGGDEAAAQPLKLDVAIDTLSACERRVRVSIPREDIDRYRDEAIGEMMPAALLPGFRPGRAPRRLVSSRFKSELSDQIRSKLLADAMTQVSEQQKLSPISEPELDVNAVLVPADGPMTFEF